ncbi:MAG: DUF6125 family protein [Candidatus Eisenbacteria bacterium]
MEAEQLRGFLAAAAKLWLAHDGLWFQAVEKRWGLEEAIACDRDAWERFSPLEARRIGELIGLAPGGGLQALEQALAHRLYSHLNRQRCEWPAPDRLVLRMETCRVQDARRRKGLADFPCRSVGLVEYETFARAIDARIRTRCISCPPDPRAAEHVCAWEFTLEAGSGD